MTTFSQVYAALRRKNKGQYALLAGCSFFSVLLITAYACMMRSPTILTVLPEGGDSRKQVMMVFVLAVIGCAVFTAYAAGLFFRQKSRETGVFLALGASRKQLRRELGKELAVISLCSCAAGAILGGPLAWAVWQLFRLFLVDSQEMALLSFDPQSYLLSLAFAAYVVGMLFLLGGRSVRRTNIIDIVQESHTSEPIRDVKRWYGWVGILLVVIGALMGYLMPSFFVTVLRWYPPEGLTAVFYLPALIGLYMMLLHTVVNGWRKRHKYRDIIATSMMKFQGRQTVRNMLVMTLLIAGAYFAAFYAPMLSTSSAYSFSTRPVDYEYHWRADQDWPERAEAEALAEEYGVDITSWQQVEAATLAGDGYVDVEQDNGALGTTYTVEYREIQGGAAFFSESAWNALTGQNIDLAPGTCANVLDDEGGSDYLSGGDVTLVTNMVTGEQLSVTPAEPLRYTMLLGCYVLDDADYAAITACLTDYWRETWVFFNVADVEASYPFAEALFNEIVDRSARRSRCSTPGTRWRGSWRSRKRAAMTTTAGRTWRPTTWPSSTSTTGTARSSAITGSTCPSSASWTRTTCHHHGGVPDAVHLHRPRVLCRRHRHRLHPLHDHRPLEPACLRRPAASGGPQRLPVPVCEGSGVPGVPGPRHRGHRGDLRLLRHDPVLQRQPLHPQ